MSSDNVKVADPSPAQFAGNSIGKTAARFFNATRPKFFPASVLPVLAGSAWGFATADQFDWLVFALALFATVCVHAASNVLNDVGDDSGGTDQRNEDRIYPYTGGSRFIQTGIMSSTEMARWGISLLALAALAGLALIFLRSWAYCILWDQYAWPHWASAKRLSQWASVLCRFPVQRGCRVLRWILRYCCIHCLLAPGLQRYFLLMKYPILKPMAPPANARYRSGSGSPVHRSFTPGCICRPR
jgi:hypothetical protein